MPLRTLAGVAAGVALTAFALGAVRLGPAAPAEPPAPAARAEPAVPPAPAVRVEPAVHVEPLAFPPVAAAPVPAVARGPAAKPAPVTASRSQPVAGGSREPRASAGQRARVAAGVLARAASLRAQGREAACAVPEEPGPAARDAGAIESIEIDWNAGPQDP